MTHELRKLQEQHRRLEADRDRAVSDFLNSRRAADLRRQIRHLGEEPCA
jgi:hypothetical protein